MKYNGEPAYPGPGNIKLYGLNHDRRKQIAGVIVVMHHSGAILYRIQTLLIQSEYIFESRSSP
jgi:hypothetical protein